MCWALVFITMALANIMRNSKKLLASHVHELMTDEVITTTPDKDVEEIVSVMLDQHLKNVPVEIRITI